MVATDYKKLAEDFLLAANVTFDSVLIGSDCPKFCDDARQNKDMDKVSTYPRKSHIHGKHYRCTFSRRKPVSEADGKPVYSTDKPLATLSIDFWNSYADEEFNKSTGKKRKPSAYDVLACMTKSPVGTFEEFCGEYGYDSDSRRAFETYTAVQGEARKCTAFFTAKELEDLQEIN